MEINFRIRNAIFLVIGFCSSHAGAVTQNFEIYGAKTAAHLAFLKEKGFTQVIVDNFALAPEAQSLSLGIVQANWWNTTTDLSVVDEQIQSAGAAPNLVSVNMMDEPDYNGVELHPPDLYMRLRQRVHKVHPTLPLSLTIHGPKPEWRESDWRRMLRYIAAVDLLRIDPYPVVAGKPLSHVYEYMRGARELIAKDGRNLPLTVILQTWSPEDDASGKPKLPTVAELRVMSYLAILGGADTLSFFDYNPEVWNRIPGFTEGFFSLIGELKTLIAKLHDKKIVALTGADGLMRAEIGNDQPSCISINSRSYPQQGLRGLEIQALERSCPTN